MSNEDYKTMISQLEALMKEEPEANFKSKTEELFASQDRGERRHLHAENAVLRREQFTEEAAGARPRPQRREMQQANTPRPLHMDRTERSRLHAEDEQHTLAARGMADNLPAERPQQQRQSVIKLHRYNGEEPADTYLLQVQLAAQINGWSAVETAGHVALSLEGRALQILTDLRPAELRDWPKLKGAIQRRFDRHLFVDDARDRLAKRRREPGESLGTYAADLRGYTRRGHPDFSESVQEELTVQAFLRGLQPGRLREHMRLFSPATLEAALIEAERVEHVLCPEGYRRSDNIRVNQAKDEDSDDADKETRRTTTTPQRRRARRGDGECYRCGATGHIARYCPAPTPQSQQPDLN